MMNKDNKWRLVSDVVAMFPSNYPDGVYITNLDNKKQESLIASDIENQLNTTNYIKVTVNNEFNIKVASGGLYVKCSNFLDSEKWYVVINFQADLIFDLVSQVKNNLGVFDETFEAIFNDNFIHTVGFICNSMDNYNSCFEEMGRRVVCDMSKKTKKRIPGHRYDSVDRSLYYLGSFKSRNNGGKFATESNMVDVDLYATNITKDDKNVSDIFKNHVIGKDIVAIPTQEALVDFGEILKNDFATEDIQNYYKYLFVNAVNDSDVSKNYIYKAGNHGRVLNLFSYQSATNLNYNLTSDVDLEAYIKDVLLGLVKSYWNKNNKFRKDNEVKEVNNIDKNTVGLINLFYANLADPNVYKDVYYSDMLKKLKIDLNKLAKEVLITWNTMKEEGAKKWDSYVKIASSVGESFTSDQRTKDVVKMEVKKTTITEQLPESLKNVIIEIAYDANDNFGLNISKYQIYNLGTKRTPREYTEMKITLDDICKSGKLNDELKDTIMKTKFNSIDIYCNKGGKLE